MLVEEAELTRRQDNVEELDSEEFNNKIISIIIIIMKKVSEGLATEAGLYLITLNRIERVADLSK